MDIIVTTPKSQSKLAAEEAEELKMFGGGFYFRVFRKRPKNLNIGDRVFYVEDGYVRGFLKVTEIIDQEINICETSGNDFGSGVRVEMDAKDWKWIKPIPMKGFQGWRYSKLETVEIIGGWLDPKPEA